ncbi:MAG: hypothetical protein BMS9Abin13_205 [Patescibacteria group bacterium]|nr:MAG: hypothetical protein BMS9Abin13_205 [Patescibacteria group bacterium]
MHKYFHQIAMWSIFIGGLVLFYFALAWFQKGNLVMGAGMLIMSIVAMSNFYLHRKTMKK